VIINGGAGGVGTFGIQIAKALGCHVTATCSAAKADLCRALGADEIIDYTATDVSQALRAKGKAYALLADNVGTPTDLYKAADEFFLPGARFMQVGAPISLAGTRMIAARSLLPSFLGGGKHKFQMTVVKHKREDLLQVAQWILEKKVRVVIEQTYEFDEVPKAFAKLKTGRTAGKLVVHVGM
jgi:NADPH:quinone reductase-like Zn-dependent oxidoreductase